MIIDKSIAPSVWFIDTRMRIVEFAFVTVIELG